MALFSAGAAAGALTDGAVRKVGPAAPPGPLDGISRAFGTLTFWAVLALIGWFLWRNREAIKNAAQSKGWDRAR